MKRFLLLPFLAACAQTPGPIADQQYIGGKGVPVTSVIVPALIERDCPEWELRVGSDCGDEVGPRERPAPTPEPTAEPEPTDYPTDKPRHRKGKHKRDKHHSR